MKKLLLCLLAALSCVSLSSRSADFKSKNVVKASNSAEIVPLSNDGESEIYGFSIDTDNYDVKWTTKESKIIYNGVYCGTLTLQLGGVKLKSKLTNGRYAYGVLVYALMTPKEFTLTSDNKTTSYRGRSRYLKITATMGTNQTLLSSKPANVAGSDSYSVGFSARAGSSGVNVGVSASTTITQNALTIVNSSDSVEGTYDICYTYNRHFWPWDWERTSYCWLESEQRATMFFSSQSSISSKSITFEPTFAIDSGTMGAWNLEMGYELSKKSYFSVSFPN